MSNAYIFDIDTLIRVDNNVWIVYKDNPSVPIIKVSQSEFNLIKKGIYRKHESKLNMDGNLYFLPKNLLNSLKIKCKNLKYDITNLAFSMQEFMNPDIIKHLDYEILTSTFQHLKNQGDIYVICSKNNKKNYTPIMEKLEHEFLNLGMEIKKYYYLSETFFNRDHDYISNIKVKLLLQHLFGLRTKVTKFTSDKVAKYDTIYYYDDEVHAIELAKDANRVFDFLMTNSDDDVKANLKDQLKKDNTIIVNQITHNKLNRFIVTEVNIRWKNLIKSFESFKYRY